jgi:hypothetical protein
MIDLPHLLWRLIVVSIGFLAAVAVSIAVAIAGLGWLPIEPTGGEVAVGDLIVVFFGVPRLAIVVPAFVHFVWPSWFVAALLSELTGTRSLLLHLFGAALLALAGTVAFGPAGSLMLPRLAAAAGFSAGFAHWLIAGRGAGPRRPRPPAPPEGRMPDRGR